MPLLLALLAAFVFAPSRPPAKPTPAAAVPTSPRPQIGQIGNETHNFFGTNLGINGATAIGNLLLMQNAATGQIMVWNTQTGLPLDRAATKGQAAIKEAMGINGSPLIQIVQTTPNYLNRYTLYRLDTGQVFPFVGDNPEETIWITAVGVTASHAIWSKYGDHGTASSLWCSDENGKVLWHFPAQIYNNIDFATDTSGELIDPTAYERDFRSVLVSELCGRRTENPIVICQVRHGNTYFLEGLRVRDGKLLWSYPAESHVRHSFYSVSDTASGAFSLNVRTDPKTGTVQGVRLDYVNAATGKMRPVTALPKNTATLAIKGDNLITTDTDGTMRVYSVKKLLGAK